LTCVCVYVEYQSNASPDPLYLLRCFKYIGAAARAERI
jgi:hypothetical protein